MYSKKNEKKKTDRSNEKYCSNKLQSGKSKKRKIEGDGKNKRMRTYTVPNNVD